MNRNIRKNLDNNEITALQDMTGKLSDLWSGISCILFGSKVSGGSDDESDIDVLILFPGTVPFSVRKSIIHIIFEINLRCETNISPLILSDEEWTNSPISVLPFHETIEQEGVLLE